MGVVVREFAHQAAQDRGRFFQQVEEIESVSSAMRFILRYSPRRPHAGHSR